MSDVLVVLIVVLILVLVWRGPKTLPGIGAAFGRGVKEARNEASKLRDGDSTTSTPGSASDDRPA